MTQLLAGTSGFSYKEWLGKFYPEKHPADGMLRYYAGHFATVEINNTFYRMPAETMLARWAEEVPENFAFTLKAPRRITHELPLKECDTHVAEFVKRAQVLGGKCWTTPVLANGKIYCRNVKGDLVCLDVKK